MAKNKKTYIFYAIIGIGILVAAFFGFNFLKGMSVFSSDNQYYIYYNSIEGLSKSNSVFVNGFAVGKVADIELIPEEDFKLKVTINVHKKYKIPVGSVARIESTDLLGSKGIILNYKKNETEFYKSGDILIGSVETSLKDQVSIQMLPVKQKAEDLMQDMSEVMEIIQSVFSEQTREDIKNSISKLTNTISHLEHAITNVDTLIYRESPKISAILANIDNFTGVLKTNKNEIDKIIKNASYFTDTLAKLDITQTINKANSTLSNLDEIISKINNGNGTISDLINNDKLMKDLEATINSLNNLVKDLQENPKKYVHFSLIDRGKTYVVSDSTQIKKGK
ncbi:MAG: MlaD family protein [Bacteroidales bacterium]|jgi:phospholipid/cholesterol/gamma-HCH transport system substrate-binding protein|nr:MlaD family protein [Bacteroidales bacterium]